MIQDMIFFVGFKDYGNGNNHYANYYSNVLLGFPAMSPGYA